MLGPNLIKGWLADINQPNKLLSLQIMNGTDLIAEVVADKIRDDIKVLFGENCYHGFENSIQLPPGVSPLHLRFLVKGHSDELKLPSNWSPVVIQVDKVTPEKISGWAWNPFDPDAHLQLCIFVNNAEIGFAVANIHRGDLAEAGFGNGNHAFSFDVAPEYEVDKNDVIVELVSFNDTMLRSSIPEIKNLPVDDNAPVDGKGPVDERGPVEQSNLEPIAPEPKKEPKSLNANVVSAAKDLARAYFDEPWYIDQAGRKDFGRSSAFDHWWEGERHKGVSPHPLFDPQFYKAEIKRKNFGVIEEKDLFLDLLYNGHKRAVDPHPCFSMQWYNMRYPAREQSNAWRDYVGQSYEGRREPNWLFSTTIVEQLIVGDRRDGETLLAYFLRKHGNHQLSPHSLLDFALVLRHNEDLKGDSLYLSFWNKYRKHDIRTHMYFNPKYYEAQAVRDNQTLRALADYVLFGEAKGYRPIPLIDPVWHKYHYGASDSYDSILEEYTAVGEKLNRHPCPGFDPRYYLEMNNDIARAGVPPLRHFLASGQRERRQIHRRFSLPWYAGQVPAPHADQALEYWLATGRNAGDAPHPAITVDNRGSVNDALTAFLTPKVVKSKVVPGIATVFATGTATQSRITPEVRGQAWLVEQYERSKQGFGILAARRLRLDEPVVRQFENFDANEERSFIRKTKADFSVRKYGQPLVSVIIPTRNRVSVLARALRSVLTQTYSKLEVIVVDDGGLDATDKLVKHYFEDSRVSYIPIKATGVSGGRNAGLNAARGEYIAYIDSDNYWEPEYLEITIKSMLMRGAKAAYAVLRAFNDKNAIYFRGAAFDFPSLKRENYIDMNVYIHHRSVVDRGILFDETLRRCVDWDFILRASEYLTPIFVPVIGCNYVDDKDTLGRITTDELSGDFYKICQRGINLEPHLTGSAPTTDCRATIIWPISGEDWKRAEADLWAVIKHIANSQDELIIINNRLDDAATAVLATISAMSSKVRVIHLWRTFHNFPAFNLASTIAKAPRLLFWRSGIVFDSAIIDALLTRAVESRAPVEIPAVTDSNGVVTSELAAAIPISQLLQPVFTGRSGMPLEGSVTGVVPVHSPVVINAQVFAELGGFSSKYAISFALADFCMRLLAKDPKATILRFDIRLRAEQMLAVVAGEGEFLKELESMKASWLGQANFPLKMSNSLEIIQPKVLGLINRNWTLCSNMANGAYVQSPLVAKAYKFVIRCPAPKSAETVSWGDYHYASAMIAALESFGHRGSIQLRDDWDETGTKGDVFFHLRGIVALKPVPGAFNAVWIISHPDKILADELASMDAVFVAGPAVKKQLAQRNGIDAHILLQGADTARFGGEIQKVGEVAGKALFVGNSRLQLRPIVLDAIEADLPLVVYGSDWSTFLPREFIKGSYIDNEVLANWYGSAGVVLNDHWNTMREYGMISNRIFDVVATGSPVITDPVEGIDQIFGDAVRSYHHVDDLPELFQEMSTRRFHDEARFVRAHHSIKARVEEILGYLGISKR